MTSTETRLEDWAQNPCPDCKHPAIDHSGPPENDGECSACGCIWLDYDAYDDTRADPAYVAALEAVLEAARQVKASYFSDRISDEDLERLFAAVDAARKEAGDDGN